MALSQHKEFINGNIHTDFIEQYKSELLDNKKVDSDVILQVIININHIQLGLIMKPLVLFFHRYPIFLCIVPV